MDFKDISYIIAVCDHNSISQAARTLFITQPALSQQIHRIEQQLGKTLFVRTGHTMTPTPVSRIIAEQGGNVTAVHHEHSNEGSDVNGCYLRLTLETRNFEHIRQIKSALLAAGLKILE